MNEMKNISVFGSYKSYLHKSEEKYLSTVIACTLMPHVSGDMRLLEIGCSTGRYAYERSRNLGITEVYGVDLGKKRLVEAEKRGVKAFCCNCEKEKLPFENGFFDVVICNQVLEHLKEIHFVMDECYRVLKNEKYFLVSVPNLVAMHNRMLMLLGKQPTTLNILSEHVRGFAPHAFKEFVLLNGLYHLLCYRCSGFYPFPLAVSKYLSRLLPGLATYQIALLKKNGKHGKSNLWVDEFKKRHIAGYGEDFWYK